MLSGDAPAHVEALTFDCYGTLVDWQRGIVDVLAPQLAALGRPTEPAALLGRFAEAERRAERGPWRPYRSVLRDVAREILGPETAPASWGALPASVGSWPSFEETVPALRRLARSYRLAIVSNVDAALFEGTRRRLEVELAAVVTAEQVRSYKPGRAHFDEVLRRLGLPAERVLHVAESRYHDVEPAAALGFSTAWIDRSRGGASASGGGTGGAEPDLVVHSLVELEGRLR